ncbi:MAG: transporter substrate-binding domain-containing protein [Synergistaceae bacterium]|jgi:polar amino acid transport system substrate-binding protein|nr:transporter substrate-binding domain-containing protein [Synergistaceae bacterium]
MSKRILVISAVFVSLFAMVSGAFAATVMDKAVITVGTEGTWPPYEFYDEDNNLTGFDIEMVAAIGEKMGKEVKVVDMAFDGLLPALISGKIDLIAAGMHSTAERKKRVDFSNVYSIADTAFIVRNDDNSINGLGDLSGKIVAVQLGTTEDIFMENQTDVKSEIKRYQKTVDAIRDLLLGRVDTVLIGTVVAKTYVEGDRFAGALKLAFRQEVDKPDEGFAIALRKNDPQLLEALNAALAELEKSGELDALKEKYGLD